jgi:hypothetical protein
MAQQQVVTVAGGSGHLNRFRLLFFYSTDCACRNQVDRSKICNKFQKMWKGLECSNRLLGASQKMVAKRFSTHIF